MEVSGSAASTAWNDGPGTLRGLIAAHKAASIIAAAICAVTIAIIPLSAFIAKAGAVTDSTTCSQWGVTNVDRQNTYAKLYVREHGPVSASWGRGPVGVINAINAGCYQAFGEDVSDTATVVQAISRDF
jgi:hypothetical protein